MGKRIGVFNYPVRDFPLTEADKVILSERRARVNRIKDGTISDDEDRTIAEIYKSIKEKGIKDPITVHALSPIRTHNIERGHTRLAIAEALGIQELKCVLLTDTEHTCEYEAENKIVEKYDTYTVV